MFWLSQRHKHGVSESPIGSVMISTEKSSIFVHGVYGLFPVSTKVPWKVPGHRAWHFSFSLGPMLMSAAHVTFT